MSNAPDEDLTVIRVDQFFPHPPAKVWRALIEPELLVQWQMQGAEAFRLVDVEVLAFEPQRMPSLRWADADPANSADWTVTWKVEQEGRGMRLSLEHEGFRSRRSRRSRSADGPDDHGRGLADACDASSGAHDGTYLAPHTSHL